MGDGLKDSVGRLLINNIDQQYRGCSFWGNNRAELNVELECRRVKSYWARGYVLDEWGKGRGGCLLSKKEEGLCGMICHATKNSTHFSPPPQPRRGN